VGLCAAVVVLWCILAPLYASADQFTGKVVGILDGDTISVLREGKAVKVRLYGVDTPEKAQAFGTQARKFAGGLVFQHDVTVVVHTTDRYGRLVGEVLLPDGPSLGHELVRAGLAWWYRWYAPHDTTLAQLEAEARTANRGLWADAHPVLPWEWRKGDREPARTEAPLASATPSTAGPVRGCLETKPLYEKRLCHIQGKAKNGLRGCLETKSLQDNSLCCVSGETKNGITGESVSYHAFRNF
jgi:micrococcal nuclease